MSADADEVSVNERGTSAPFAPCDTCGFELWLPLWHLEGVQVGFYNDDRFPGRCIVALEEHATAVEDLERTLITHLMTVSTGVGKVVRELVNADRVNYAILGNTEPHVHVHVIPRVYEIDPIPDRPPWEHPRKLEPLNESRREALMRQIAGALEVRETELSLEDK